MRFKITFSRTGKQRMLPMDYQYFTSAWIYKVIGNADREFSQFLHSVGYSDGNKRFKLFNYSPLEFGNYVTWKEKSLFEINTETLNMLVSFYMPEAAERFIIGLFKNQKVYIGDKFNGLDLAVTGVERLSDPDLSRTIRYRTLSPVVISFHNEGDRYTRYLSPVEKGYSDLVRSNLIQRWKTVPGSKQIEEDISFNMDPGCIPKSKLVTIKPYTEEESKVRGFLFKFSLSAPEVIHHLILSSGFGEKNSMGFGWVEIISNLTAFEKPVRVK